MGQVVAEYLSTAALTSPLRNWVYGSYVDEPLLLEDRTALGASAAGTRERVYLHHSNNFDVQAVTNSAGATVELYAYTPYGTRSVFAATGTARTTVPTGAAAAGASGNTSWIGNAIGFTGREHDGETGLMYYRARMYDATHGRFIGRDPLGYVDGPNAYRGWFVVGGMDPSGTILAGFFACCTYRSADGHWWSETIGVPAALPWVKDGRPVGTPPCGKLTIWGSPPDVVFSRWGSCSIEDEDAVIDDLNQTCLGVACIGLGTACDPAKVLQSGGHVLTDFTRKRLGLSKDQAKRAMENGKLFVGQSSACHSHKIMCNGDVLDKDTGGFLFNLFDFL